MANICTKKIMQFIGVSASLRIVILWNHQKTMKYMLTLFLVIGLSAIPVSAKLLDPHSPQNEILDALADKIDSHGIDVARQWTATAKPGERPILAPLHSFTSAAEAKKSKTLWMRDFRGKIESVLLGIKDNKQQSAKNLSGQISRDPGAFKDVWEDVSKSQRVFISFTKVDATHAAKVKKALENIGYTTFIYLNGSQESPLVTPAEAGHFFATAGHHFVIDTKAARHSGGVWFEKALLGRYIAPADTNKQAVHKKKRRAINNPAPPSSSLTVGDCTCNTFRNGVLIRSSRIPVGASCGGQICGH